MAMHAHPLQTAFVAGQPLPAATSKDRFPVFVPYQQSDVQLGVAFTAPSGGSEPMWNVPAYQPLTYCIVVNGLQF